MITYSQNTNQSSCILVSNMDQGLYPGDSMSVVCPSVSVFLLKLNMEGVRQLTSQPRKHLDHTCQLQSLRFLYLIFKKCRGQTLVRFQNHVFKEIPTDNCKAKTRASTSLVVCVWRIPKGMVITEFQLGIWAIQSSWLCLS